VVAYEARDKSRVLLKLMTESTRKAAGLLEAVKKENIVEYKIWLLDIYKPN
jgi:hypothetical protein